MDLEQNSKKRERNYCKHSERSLFFLFLPFFHLLFFFLHSLALAFIQSNCFDFSEPDWNEKFQNCLDELKKSKDEAEQELNYSKLANLSQDFSNSANVYRRVIISEGSLFTLFSPSPLFSFHLTKISTN